MNFQQLRIVRETVRRGFNLTEVANALHISQPAVSKNIKDLEVGLGIGIIAPMAVNPAKDSGLALLPSEHLFPESITRRAVHRGVYLRDYARQFVAMVAPGSAVPGH